MQNDEKHPDTGDSPQEDWINRFEEPENPHNGASGESGTEDAGSGPGAENTGGRGGVSLLPKPTFSTFVLSLASSALVQLGEVPDPSSGTVAEDLALAKHSIDILSMLQDKIATGLDEEEKRLLDGLLYELRMKFVMKK